MQKADGWRHAVVKMIASMLAVPIEAVATTSTMTIKVDVDADAAMQTLDALKRRAEEIARLADAAAGSDGNANASEATLKRVLEQLIVLGERDNQMVASIKALSRCVV